MEQTGVSESFPQSECGKSVPERALMRAKPQTHNKNPQKNVPQASHGKAPPVKRAGDASGWLSGTFLQYWNQPRRTVWNRSRSGSRASTGAAA